MPLTIVKARGSCSLPSIRSTPAMILQRRFTLNDNGDLSVNVTATAWEMAGTLTKNARAFRPSRRSHGHHAARSTLSVNAGSARHAGNHRTAGADVNVNGTLILGGGTELAGPATLTGTGTLRMEGRRRSRPIRRSAWPRSTGTALGTGTSHTINDGVVFTINSRDARLRRRHGRSRSTSAAMGRS